MPSVMGSESFVEVGKKKFFSKKRHEDALESKLLAPDGGKVKDSGCRLYGVSEEDLVVSMRGKRNQASNTGGDNMGAVKKQVIQMIQHLPNDVTIDDIFAELYFKLQVDAGLEELDEGRGIPHEEVKEHMSKWISQ